jgi:hypothetical protein
VIDVSDSEKRLYDASSYPEFVKEDEQKKNSHLFISIFLAFILILIIILVTTQYLEPIFGKADLSGKNIILVLVVCSYILFIVILSFLAQRAWDYCYVTSQGINLSERKLISGKRKLIPFNKIVKIYISPDSKVVIIYYRVKEKITKAIEINSVPEIEDFIKVTSEFTIIDRKNPKPP